MSWPARARASRAWSATSGTSQCRLRAPAGRSRTAAPQVAARVAIAGSSVEQRRGRARPGRAGREPRRPGATTSGIPPTRGGSCRGSAGCRPEPGSETGSGRSTPGEQNQSRRAHRHILWTMPSLHSRLGTWELENVHAWSDRALEIRAPAVRLVGPETRVATIGSCFAAELASMMGVVGMRRRDAPGRPVLLDRPRSARSWSASPAAGRSGRRRRPGRSTAAGSTRSATTARSTRIEASLDAARSAADTAAGEVFRGAGVVVVDPRPDRDVAQPGDRRARTARSGTRPSFDTARTMDFHRLSVDRDARSTSSVFGTATATASGRRWSSPCRRSRCTRPSNTVPVQATRT